MSKVVFISSKGKLTSTLELYPNTEEGKRQWLQDNKVTTDPDKIAEFQKAIAEEIIKEIPLVSHPNTIYVRPKERYEY